ncbi:MAG: hypothetical protein ACXVY9_11045, partial [Terriglobales bacterium]
MRTAPKPRKAEKITADDVHVKIAEMPLPRMVERGGSEAAAAAPAPGLGGRYVYGIIEARD